MAQACNGTRCTPGRCCYHKVQVRAGDLQRLHNGVLAHTAGAADDQLHRLHLGDLQRERILAQVSTAQSSSAAMLWKSPHGSLLPLRELGSTCRCLRLSCIQAKPKRIEERALAIARIARHTTADVLRLPRRPSTALYTSAEQIVSEQALLAAEQCTSLSYLLLAAVEDTV